MTTTGWDSADLLTRFNAWAGRPSTDAITDEARRLAGAAGPRILHTGEFDLSELHALVSRSALYIGGDSGPMHVAATTRTPMLALFGPTLPDRSMPWRDPLVPALPASCSPTGHTASASPHRPAPRRPRRSP